jgi:hypothetical protein
VAGLANERTLEADGANDCAAQSAIFAVFFRANRESENGDGFAADSLHRQAFTPLCSISYRRILKNNIALLSGGYSASLRRHFAEKSLTGILTVPHVDGWRPHRLFA